MYLDNSLFVQNCVNFNSCFLETFRRQRLTASLDGFHPSLSSADPWPVSLSQDNRRERHYRLSGSLIRTGTDESGFFWSVAPSLTLCVPLRCLSLLCSNSSPITGVQSTGSPWIIENPRGGGEDKKKRGTRIPSVIAPRSSGNFDDYSRGAPSCVLWDEWGFARGRV